MTRSDQSSCSGLVTEGLDWKLYTLTHHKLGITSRFTTVLKDYKPAYLPSSSTSAGAVPAFLASSNSFLLRQSSLDNF